MVVGQQIRKNDVYNIWEPLEIRFLDARTGPHISKWFASNFDLLLP